eukprot:661549-Amphidinium_carterae.1
MTASSLSALATLLGEVGKRIPSLGKEYSYSGGNPGLMRSYIEGLNSEEHIYTVVSYVFIVVACLLYGTTTVRAGAPTSAKAASWTNQSREIMRAASAAIHKFEKLPGYTLGSLTSSPR